MLLSRLAEGGSVKHPPIRRIVEMAEKENIKKLGLNPGYYFFYRRMGQSWSPEDLRKEYLKIVEDRNLFHAIGEYSSMEGDFSALACS